MTSTHPITNPAAASIRYQRRRNRSHHATVSPIDATATAADSMNFCVRRGW